MSSLPFTPLQFAAIGLTALVAVGVANKFRVSRNLING